MLSDPESILCSHIRDILSDYSSTHLLINHVDFTDKLLPEILAELLTPVKLHDPVILAPQPDPFEALKRQFSLDGISPYDEVWSTDPRALRFIRDQLLFHGELKSNRVWDDDKDEDWESKLIRPLTPMLSRSSRRKMSQSTRPRASTSNRKAPIESLQAVSKLLTVTLLLVDDSQDRSQPSLEDFLDTKLRIDSATHAELTQLVRIVSKGLTGPSGSQNHDTESFLRCISPVPQLTTPMSPPIFHRSRDRRCGIHADSYPQSIAECSKMISLIEVETEDIDIANENLTLISGWAILGEPLSQSSIGTPSLASSSSDIDQIDESWLPSSPSALPAAIRLLKDAKMDEVLIPRSERLDGAVLRSSLSKSSMETSRLANLVANHLPIRNPRIFSPTNMDQGTICAARSSPPLSFSMLGQPPSDLESDTNRQPETGDNVEEGSLEQDLKQLYSSVGLGSFNPYGFLLDERPDDGQSLLLDVPFLPPPNEHKREIVIPSSLKDFVQGPQPTIRKIMGIKSLNIELSWRPFNFESEIPTHASLIGVEELNFQRSIDFEGYFASLILSDAKPPSEWIMETTRPNPNLSMDFSEDELIFTKAERRYLAKQDNDPRSPSVSDIDTGPDATVPHPDSYLRSSPSPDDVDTRKRLKLDSAVDYRTPDLSASRQTDQDSSDILPMDYYPCNTEQHSAFITPYCSSTDLPVGLADLDSLHISGSQDWSGRHATANWSAREESVLDIALEGSLEPFKQHSAAAAEIHPGTNVSFPLVVSQHGSQPQLISDHRDPPLNAVVTRSPLEDSCTAVESAASKLNSLHNFLMLRCELKEDLSPDIQEHVEAERGTPLVIQEQAEEQLVLEAPERVSSDANTLILPEFWEARSTTHRYLISLEFLQQHVLVGCLESEECSVQLVEREDLLGPDIILNAHSCILYHPLSALPAQSSELLTRISELSWSFTYIFIMLRAFPTSMLFHAHRDLVQGYNAYSPAVLKAITTLRRGVHLREGLGEKNPRCQVLYAFPDSIQQTALFTRMVGEMMIGDEFTGREWQIANSISEDELDGERELAGAKGMNVFAASLILSQCSLNDVLEMMPTERLDLLGPLVGDDRIEILNEQLSERMKTMSASLRSSSSPSHAMYA